MDNLISRPYASHCKEYKDQLSDEEHWFLSSQATRYLRKKYNLSCQEYYNLICYGNKDYVNRCIRCGKPTKWKSLSRGWDDYCSMSCACADSCEAQHCNPNSPLKIALNKFLHSKENIEACSKRITEYNRKSWSDPEYRRIKSETTHISINRWDAKVRAHYKDFLSKGNISDTCDFYIALTRNEDIKFGVTFAGIQDRKYRCAHKYIHSIFKGSRLAVAKLERDVKFHFKSDSEIIPYNMLSELIRFIRSYITDSTTTSNEGTVK